MFIVFGLMCFLAAAHFFLAYPETANKTLEEVEEMFAHGGPRPWQTRRGESRLDEMVLGAREKGLRVEDVGVGGEEGGRVGSLEGKKREDRVEEEGQVR